MPGSSLLSCRRCYPAGAVRLFSQLETSRGAFAHRQRARPPDLLFSRPSRVHFRYGPKARLPPQGWLCHRAPGSRFPSFLSIKLQGSGFCPGGLYPPLNVTLVSGRTAYFSSQSVGPRVRSEQSRSFERPEAAGTTKWSPLRAARRRAREGETGGERKAARQEAPTQAIQAESIVESARRSMAGLQPAEARRDY